MKKILHILFSLGSGGLENMVVDIANVQSSTNDVQIVVINSIIDQYVISRVKPEVHIVQLNRKPKSKSIKPVINFYKSYFLFNPDLVHIHCRNALKFFPLFFSRWWPNIIYTVHDTGAKFRGEIRNCNTVCAISNAVKKDLTERECINSVTIYNGIPSEQIKTGKIISNKPETIRIVQISRLMPKKKGQDLLLKAVAEIQQQEPGFSLQVDFIGGGEQKVLQNMADELGLSQCVNFLGTLPKDEVYRQLHTYDILIQPSRYEGFGLTLAEGMVAGVPVIGSDIEGPMEVIADERYGKVFESGCYHSLAHTIMRTVEDYKSGVIKEQVRVARQRACELFDIKKTAERYAQY